MADTPIPIEVFCSYAPADEDLYNKLEKHLSVLKRNNLISLWNSRAVVGGAVLQEDIDTHLDNASLILLLISSDFMASDYHYSVEMERALERQRKNEARVVPILLRPAEWKETPLGRFSALPSNDECIVKWPNQDDAFLDVAKGLRRVIENLPSTITLPAPRPLTAAPDRPSGSSTSASSSVSNRVSIASTAPVPVSKDAGEILRAKRAAQSFDVFLCHHTIDKPAVKSIAEQLQAQGILPWLDEWELQPGLPWQTVLEHQIGQIKSAAVFVGKGGIGPWQQQELNAFLREFVERHVPLIPVLLPDAPLEPALPMFLKGMTWVDFRKHDPTPLPRLIWGITGIRPGS